MTRPNGHPVGGVVVDVLIEGNYSEGEVERQGAGAEHDM